MRGLSRARSNVSKATKKIEGCKDNLDGGSEGSELTLSESELHTHLDSFEVTNMTAEEIKKLILQNKELMKKAAKSEKESRDLYQGYMSLDEKNRATI